jgi:hypothetical protein
LNRDWLTANKVGKKLLNMGAFHAAVEVYGILADLEVCGPIPPYTLTTGAEILFGKMHPQS